MKRATAKRREDKALVNEQIVASPVRLIAADGSQVGIVSREDALDEARKSHLDLVLIAPQADPVVCKIMDYGKHLFEQKKAKSAQRKKQKQIQVKE
ncbi:MAG: translation initiation factor IF-3, partial [Gammaproteobacteria bacterium]